MSKYRIENDKEHGFWNVMFEGDTCPVSICSTQRSAYASMLDAIETDGEELPKPEVTDEMVSRAISAMDDSIHEECGCDVCKKAMRAALEAALGEK